MPLSASDHKYDPGGFACQVDDHAGGVVRVLVFGEIDIATAPALSRALGEALERGATVVLDLGGVSFCDSTAVHVIMGAARHAREHDGRLVLIEGSAQVRRLFELVGLVGRLDVVRDPDDLVTRDVARREWSRGAGPSARQGVSRWKQRRA